MANRKLERQLTEIRKTKLKEIESNAGEAMRAVVSVFYRTLHWTWEASAGSEFLEDMEAPAERQCVA